MNILVLSGSPRKNGNTAAMVDAFAEGAGAYPYPVHPICAGPSCCPFHVKRERRMEETNAYFTV